MYSNKTFQIQCEATLNAFVGTSRAFRDIFTPALHVRRTIYLHRCPISGLDQKTLPPGISHTRDLEVRLEDFHEAGNGYDFSMNNDLASFVTRILKGTSNLRSFKSVTTLNPSQMPLWSLLI
jgi:hypothetical protein